MIEWFGADIVEVIKVDGNIGRDISKKYRVEGYPKFIMLFPHSNGNKISTYRAEERTYESIKNWALKNLQDVTPRIAIPNH